MTDLRYALRLLRRSRVFAAAVIGILAIGVGAGTTIFSIAHAVLLRPLPFRDPDRLMQIAERNDRLHLPTFAASALNYLSWKDRTHTFEQLGAMGFQAYTLSGIGDPETYSGGPVSASLLPLLGIHPEVGRGFTAADERPGAAPVALISPALWHRKFQGDPGVIGRAVTVNGASCTIVGVAPAPLALLVNGDVWTPLVIDPPKEVRLNHVLVVVGRLKPRVTMAEAQAEMDGISASLGHEYPEVRDWAVRLVTMTDTVVSPQLRTALLVLLGAVAFLLLIVTANVANLVLARALERRPEMALRSALGAPRSRLLKQLIVESVLLSSLGGVAGAAFAFWGLRVVQAALPPNTLPVADIGLDGPAILFTIAATLVTGLLFGIVPAWEATGSTAGATLQDMGRSAAGSMRPTLRRLLVAVELALATILLVGAALLTRTLLKLQTVPLGFDPTGVMSFQVSLPDARYDLTRRIMFFREFDHAIAALPGVQRVGLSSAIPFGAGLLTRSPFAAPGSRTLPSETPVSVDWRMVSPGFFDTMRIPLLEGRVFSESDTEAAPGVIIVSRNAARTFWGDEAPLGRTLRLVATGKPFTVVGVVGDVRNISLDTEAPTLYVSTGWRTWPSMDVVVRSSGDASAIMAAVRKTLGALDPALALSNVRPMTAWLSVSAAQARLNAVLLSVFAGVALLVAAVGVYGVLAYSVSQRTRELGLRLALGADRADVLRLIVREGMTVGALGIACGVAGAIAMSGAFRSLVYGVSPHDPLTYAVVAGLLGLVALASCVLPAVRASRVDPMTALRLD